VVAVAEVVDEVLDEVVDAVVDEVDDVALTPSVGAVELAAT
jgi:vacuolar-type H+-ATPase subunit E/Vma4